MPSLCADCHTPLTPEEMHYYEYRCEICETRWSERLTRWRRGAPDPEFDALFNEPFG